MVKKEKAPPDRPGLGLACRWAAGTSTRSAAREAQSEKKMEKWKNGKGSSRHKAGPGWADILASEGLNL